MLSAEYFNYYLVYDHTMFNKYTRSMKINIRWNMTSILCIRHISCRHISCTLNQNIHSKLKSNALKVYSMTEKRLALCVLFSTIHIPEFLHISEKKLIDIFRKKWQWNWYLLSFVKYIPSNQNHSDPKFGVSDSLNGLLTCRCACDVLNGIFYELKFIGK